MGTCLTGQILRRETTGVRICQVQNVSQKKKKKLTVWELKLYFYPSAGGLKKMTRDIGKRTSLGCHLISFRYGDHTFGFQMKGLETTSLVFAQPQLV